MNKIFLIYTQFMLHFDSIFFFQLSYQWAKNPVYHSSLLHLLKILKGENFRFLYIVNALIDAGGVIKSIYDIFFHLRKLHYSSFTLSFWIKLNCDKTFSDTWIGLTHKNQAYYWDDGSNSTFRNWKPNYQYSDVQKDNLNCVAMDMDGYWKNYHCSNKFYFVCRKELGKTTSVIDFHVLNLNLIL